MHVPNYQESPHPLHQVTRAEKRSAASSSRGVVSADGGGAASEEEEEEDCEPIEMDALVFDREEYNSGKDIWGTG